MKRPSGWLAGLPLVLVVAAFALSNRQRVTLDLWPLPVETTLPLYLAVLGPLALGLLGGAARGAAAAAGAVAAARPRLKPPRLKTGTPVGRPARPRRRRRVIPA